MHGEARDGSGRQAQLVVPDNAAEFMAEMLSLPGLDHWQRVFEQEFAADPREFDWTVRA